MSHCSMWLQYFSFVWGAARNLTEKHIAQTWVLYTPNLLSKVEKALSGFWTSQQLQEQIFSLLFFPILCHYQPLSPLSLGCPQGQWKATHYTAADVSRYQKLMSNLHKNTNSICLLSTHAVEFTTVRTGYVLFKFSSSEGCYISIMIVQPRLLNLLQEPVIPIVYC